MKKIEGSTMRIFITLTCMLVMCGFGSLDAEEFAPLFSLRLNSLEGYDFGMGLIWGHSRAGFLAGNGNSHNIGCEVGWLDYLDDGHLGNGIHYGIKARFKYFVDDNNGIDQGEHLVGLEFQMGIAGHSVPWVASVGVCRLTASDRTRFSIGISCGI